MIQHIILRRWREDASEDAIRLAIESMKAINEIKGVTNLVLGSNCAMSLPGFPRHVVRGDQFAFVMIITMPDREFIDRVYRPHPIHRRFSELADPISADVMVLDVEY